MSSETCLTCNHSDVWPTGEGICDKRKKGIYGNDKACFEFNNDKEFKPDDLDQIP